MDASEIYAKFVLFMFLAGIVAVYETGSFCVLIGIVIPVVYGAILANGYERYS
jgi:hypothetical protein